MPCAESAQTNQPTIQDNKNGRKNTLLLAHNQQDHVTTQKKKNASRASKQAESPGSRRSPATRRPLVTIRRFLLGFLHEFVHLRAYPQNLFLGTFLETRAGGGRARVGVRRGWGVEWLFTWYLCRYCCVLVLNYRRPFHLYHVTTEHARFALDQTPNGWGIRNSKKEQDLRLRNNRLDTCQAHGVYDCIIPQQRKEEGQDCSRESKGYFLSFEPAEKS